MKDWEILDQLEGIDRKFDIYEHAMMIINSDDLSDEIRGINRYRLAQIRNLGAEFLASKLENTYSNKF